MKLINEIKDEDFKRGDRPYTLFASIVEGQRYPFYLLSAGEIFTYAYSLQFGEKSLPVLIGFKKTVKEAKQAVKDHFKDSYERSLCTD